MTAIYEPCSCGSGKKFKFCCYEKRNLLSNVSAQELLRRSGEFPVYECLICEGWEDLGLAQILLVRQLPNLKYHLGIYLVDIFCLGLKNTICFPSVKYEHVTEIKNSLRQNFIEIPYEDIRSLIFGAIEYADQLGFKPNIDWKDSKLLLEPERIYEKKYTFGKEGKPFYIEGPEDDTNQIMKKLAPLIDIKEADFIHMIDMEDDDNKKGLEKNGFMQP